MPDTLNLPRYSMVGEMNNRHMEAMPDGHYFDAVEVLARIDALTAAVEGLPSPWKLDEDWVNRAAVLAILRGES